MWITFELRNAGSVQPPHQSKPWGPGIARQISTSARAWSPETEALYVIAWGSNHPTGSSDGKAPRRAHCTCTDPHNIPQQSSPVHIPLSLFLPFILLNPLSRPPIIPRILHHPAKTRQSMYFSKGNCTAYYSLNSTFFNDDHIVFCSSLHPIRTPSRDFPKSINLSCFFQ